MVGENEEKKRCFEADDATVDIFPNYRTSSTSLSYSLYSTEKSNWKSLFSLYS